MLEINVTVKVEGLEGLVDAIRSLKAAPTPELIPVVVTPEEIEPKKPGRKKAPKEEAKPEETAETTPAPEVKPVVVAKPKDDQSKNDAAMLYKLSEAGASLLEAGKMQELINLLHSFHVEAVTMLKPEQYDDFARGLRGLGAMI